jgi:hypothetical protein
MVYRKGELSPARVDRGWPHQIALPAADVHCFADAEHAEKFMRRFGGEKFHPKQRGKGSNWARWKK